MSARYLQITFRQGKPLAAYLYLPRTGRGKAVRTTDEGRGLRVDCDADGAPMGIEITSLTSVELEHVNAVLRRLGQPELTAEEWAPARAA